MDLVELNGGSIVGIGVIVDRSSGSVNLHSNQLSLASLEVQSYDPNELPPQLASLPVEKPGSRSLAE
jgi:orotate phosphoribosyltransferase